MFIESVSDQAKERFINNFIAKWNQSRQGLEKFSPAKIGDVAQCFRCKEFQEFFDVLKEKNIFVRFYTSMVKYGKKDILTNDFMAFCFGDTSWDLVRFSHTNLHLKDMPQFAINDFRHLKDDTVNLSKLDMEYIKQFVLPNLPHDDKIKYEQHIFKMQQQKKSGFDPKADDNFSK